MMHFLQTTVRLENERDRILENLGKIRSSTFEERQEVLRGSSFMQTTRASSSSRTSTSSRTASRRPVSRSAWPPSRSRTKGVRPGTPSSSRRTGWNRRCI